MSSAQTSRRFGVVAIATLGLLGASCGRSDDAAPATTAAPPVATAAATTAPEAAPTVTEAGPPEATEVAPAPTEAPTTTEAGPGPGDFGDLKGICGPGDAKGSTEQGVSDTEIVIGTASDAGNTIAPGLNQEIFDGADAFVGWCNAAGGINGRKIKLNKHDAKLFEAAPAMVEACQTDFMLVGPGMALDDTSVEPRVACGLTQIATYTVSKVAGRAEGSIEAITNADYQTHLEPLMRAVAGSDPTALTAYALLNNSFPAVTPTGLRARGAAELNGYTEVHYDELPSQVDNWRPYAEKLKEVGAVTVNQIQSYQNLVSLLKSLSDVDYFPKYFVLDANYYNANLVAEAGDLLDKTTVLVNGSVIPFELAGPDYPATARYLELLKEYAGDAPPKSLGINAFSAWLLWAQSARDCGSELTRACVMEKASAVKGWTGGGLHVPTNPSNTAGSNSECFFMMQATSKGFIVREDLNKPNQGIFNCDPANVVNIPGFEP